MKTHNIVSASLTKNELELITDKGETISIRQGHPNIKVLMDKVLPAILSGNSVTITDNDLTVDHVYSRFEKKTKGRFKFYQVLKDKLSLLFGSSASSEKKQEILEQVTDELISPNKTVVCMVDDVPVPNMEHLSAHLHHALVTNNPVGVAKLIERLSKIIHERNHTVEECLNFLKKADLPIANDGSIIIYKGLMETDIKGEYVDRYTRTIRQRVGSKVITTHVDPNRRLECSTGLHVARKGYLENFHTDVIVLAYVQPEDIIAVPQNEPKKMRVRAYHNVALLPHLDALAVRKSEPMVEGSIGSIMLAKAINNEFPAPYEEVLVDPINKTVTVNPIGFTAKKKTKRKTVKPIPQVSEKTETIKEVVVDPVRVANQVKKVKKMTKSEEIKLLYEQFNATDNRNTRRDILANMLDLKRTSKKSWGYHGIEPKDAKRITDLAKTMGL